MSIDDRIEADSPRNSIKARINWVQPVCSHCNRYLDFGEDSVIFGGPHLDHPETNSAQFHTGFMYPECRQIAQWYGRRWEFRLRKIKRKRESRA